MSVRSKMIRQTPIRARSRGHNATGGGSAVEAVTLTKPTLSRAGRSRIIPGVGSVVKGGLLSLTSQRSLGTLLVGSLCLSLFSTPTLAAAPLFEEASELPNRSRESQKCIVRRSNNEPAFVFKRRWNNIEGYVYDVQPFFETYDGESLNRPYNPPIPNVLEKDLQPATNLFKVGDKVKISLKSVSARSESLREHSGKTGTIHAIHDKLFTFDVQLHVNREKALEMISWGQVPKPGEILESIPEVDLELVAEAAKRGEGCLDSTEK